MGHYRKKLCTFILSNKCNLACNYCWVKFEKLNYEKKVINVEFAKRGLCDFYKETKSNYIGFFASGEPTLELQVMTDILEYAKKLIGNVKVELQTNAYFGKKVLTWIYYNVDILWISADGPPVINDLNRITNSGKGTAAIIEHNIRELYKLNENEKRNMSIGIRSTIGNFNVYKQKEIIDYYYELGIRAIYVDQICEPVCKQESDFLTGAVDSLVFAEQFYEAYCHAKERGVFYGTLATMNFDESVTIACRSLIPVPHLTPDGLVSACEMCYEEGSPLDIFIYGKWNTSKCIIEYDTNKIDVIRSRTIDNLEECQECEFLKNCAGSCAGETLNETGSLYKRNERLCKIVKYLGNKIVRNSDIYPYLHP
jgi:radical SAM protein with 4Fe4S-binding SPASM domain